MPKKADLARPHVEDRGELALVLDGVTMVLRPTFEAIEAFEAATGKGLMQIARDAIDGRLTVGETAQIACECIRAWGRETDNEDAAGARPKRVANLILDAEGGFRAASGTVAAVLALAATGGYTSSGELKPVTTKKTTDASVAG